MFITFAFSKPPIGKRGYNEDEVDAFLDLVEAELIRRDEIIESLTQKVNSFSEVASYPPLPVDSPPPDYSGQSTYVQPSADLKPSAVQKANDGSGVFISYRRGDESNFAGRLFERLDRTWVGKKVFLDVDRIDLGLDFKEVIDGWLAQCSVMLVIIGNKWLDFKGPDGQRRLDDPDDFLRLEVEGALARPGVRVIPILVDGASVPSASDLPESLKPLARRNGLSMTHGGFGSDFDRLFSTLQRVV